MKRWTREWFWVVRLIITWYVKRGRLSWCKVGIWSGGMKCLSRGICKHVACACMSYMICSCHGDRWGRMYLVAHDDYLRAFIYIVCVVDTCVLWLYIIEYGYISIIDRSLYSVIRHSSVCCVYGKLSSGAAVVRPIFVYAYMVTLSVVRCVLVCTHTWVGACMCVYVHCWVNIYVGGYTCVYVCV